jgi:hypothetical protein
MRGKKSLPAIHQRINIQIYKELKKILKNNPTNKWANELDSSQKKYKWQRNANQNYREIPFHPNLTAIIKKCWLGWGGDTTVGGNVN